MRTALLLLLAGAIAAPVSARTQGQKVNPDAQIQADFVKRVEEYVAFRDKLEDTLKDLPSQTDPAAADRHQRALQKLVQENRTAARRGDLFTPPMQRRVRALLAPVFSGRGGRQIRAEIHDSESKSGVPLRVNARYPDDVPLSTVPPQVLKSLPKLPGELEYRFIGTTLILFDPHAHVIVDYMTRAYR